MRFYKSGDSTVSLISSIYFHRKGIDHQNGPAVKNGSFIKIRNITIAKNNLGLVRFTPKRVAKNIPSPITPIYRIREKILPATTKSLCLNDSSLYP